MKKLLLITFSTLTLLNSVKSQESSLEEPMKSSICYDGSLLKNYGRVLKADYNSYPEDLKNASFFFIEINKDETYGNTGMMGPRYKKINSKLINEMSKKLPVKFESFSNDYLFKETNYFINKGYKYRVLILSHWYYSRGDWRQNFTLMVQNIETGKTYAEGEWFWHKNYISKFIKHFN